MFAVGRVPVARPTWAEPAPETFAVGEPPVTLRVIHGGGAALSGTLGRCPYVKQPSDP